MLESIGRRLAFVAIDLAVFTSDRVERICKEKYGISQLFLCSSHAHSEPQPEGKRSFQGNPYTSFYEDRIILAVGQAVQNLFPARLTAGRRSFPHSTAFLYKGRGEAIITRQLENFYRLNGLMRDKPGPIGFKGGEQRVIKPFRKTEKTK